MSAGVSKAIDGILNFAVSRALLAPEDRAFAQNRLLEIMQTDAPEAYEGAPEDTDTLTPWLNALSEEAVKARQIDDSREARERFGARLAGAVTPSPYEVRQRFFALYAQSPARATDWFYQMCRDCDYIKVDAVNKNVRFFSPSPAGELEITINLSKPEKDPRDIAKARLAKNTGYPKCMLCAENPGYAGRQGFPARQNHRMIPITLGGAPFYMQYSPYLYYHEHCIVLNDLHVPMRVNRESLSRLFDFIEQFPHYFIGSNADLPIVGGSILSHDHFQGGHYVFPMDRAGNEFELTCDDGRIRAAVANWPMTCVRLYSRSREALLDQAERMLCSWREYSDPALDIYARTDAPHNTITPILRQKDGCWTLSLVLRNNRASAEHPLGIFHPHADLHHIKKENIGLIEVMGLFILPGRLLTELAAIERCLTGEGSAEEVSAAHETWLKSLRARAYAPLPQKNAQALVRAALAEKCARVLTDAGVYKRDDAGRAGLTAFLRTVGLTRA